jgi:hypothetical protein
MFDDNLRQGQLQQKAPSSGLSGILQLKQNETEGPEASCPAFGWLRSTQEHAAAVEFRFRNGSSTWFSYHWLGSWQFNPSVGLLLKFSGDQVYLVLIRGSNLDKPLKEGSINLMNAGLQRHRVLWVREMTEEEIANAGDSGPTIDSIEVVQCESQAALKEWLSKNAPAFLR